MIAGSRGSGAARRVLLIALLAAALAGGWYYYQQSRQDTEVHERSGLVMGTFVNLRAVGAAAPAALAESLAELERLEAIFSYNLPDSEVSRLNAAAGRGPVDVGPEMVEVLLEAQRIAELSGGSFDVTIAPVVDAWGFRPDLTEQRVPDPDELSAALALVDYRQLLVDAAAGQAELMRAGMSVDLGAIAKGYAVDRVVAILHTAGIKSALVDVGGNIHALGLRPTGQAWRVGLQHPRESQQLLGVLSLTGRNIATSGDYQRFFVLDGRRYHHIIDPRTGYPAQAVMMVAIVADTGMEADAVSTAAFVLGAQEGLALVRRMGLEAVLYTGDGQLQLTAGLTALFEAPR